jgi:hypothetical protein
MANLLWLRKLHCRSASGRMRIRLVAGHSGVIGSECRLGFKHTQLQQQPREIVDPDLPRDSAFREKKQECAADFKLFSGRCQAAEIAPLRSCHPCELYSTVSIYQQVLSQALYVGKGREPFFVDVLNRVPAFDFAPDRAFHLSIGCMILRECQMIMPVPNRIPSRKKLGNFPGSHEFTSFLVGDVFQKHTNNFGDSHHNLEIMRSRMVHGLKISRLW